MLPAPYITRALNHSFSSLYGQSSVAVKRSELGSGWSGWAWRPTPVQQRRFASNKDKRPAEKDKGWYDWYERLHADPRASVKDLRKAYYKRAKVEHPDHDKTPGAKDRFQNLQDTFEWLCDESKRKEHDQQRLFRQKAAAAQMMASQPSVADSLQAKWKAEEEALRKTEDMRTREARKTAQGEQQRTKPSSKPHEPKADSRKPEGSKPENSKEAPRKKQKQQTKAEKTEEDRLKKQKIADDRLAKKKAAAQEKKRREDVAAETRQNSLLQERVVVIRDLPPETEVVDLFKPLLELTPGPVFCARLRSRGTAEIEFCTATAARKVLTLAGMHRLFIKGVRVTNVSLSRSMNRLPVTGTRSRVLRLERIFGAGVCSQHDNPEGFLKSHGFQVERTVKDGTGASNSITVRFSSWAEAERARRLLDRHLRGFNVSYGPDPCGSESDSLYRTAGDKPRSNGSANSKRKREETSGQAGDSLVAKAIFLTIVLVLLFSKPRRRLYRPSPMFDYQRQMIKLIEEADKEQK